MKQKEKQEPSKWVVFNQITGEVVRSDMDKYEADNELAGIFVIYWKQCFCRRQEQLLDRAFPYEKRRMGKTYGNPPRKLVEAWTEYQRIDKEFCDAWNNAPTQEEARKATEALRHHYDEVAERI